MSDELRAPEPADLMVCKKCNGAGTFVPVIVFVIGREESEPIRFPEMICDRCIGRGVEITDDQRESIDIYSGGPSDYEINKRTNEAILSILRRRMVDAGAEATNLFDRLTEEVSKSLEGIGSLDHLGEDDDSTY